MDDVQMTKAEQEAHERAIKKVASLLQRPEHLDKLEQHRRRVAREKVNAVFYMFFLLYKKACSPALIWFS